MQAAALAGPQPSAPVCSSSYPVIPGDFFPSLLDQQQERGGTDAQEQRVPRKQGRFLGPIK